VTCRLARDLDADLPPREYSEKVAHATHTPSRPTSGDRPGRFPHGHRCARCQAIIKAYKKTTQCSPTRFPRRAWHLFGSNR